MDYILNGFTGFEGNYYDNFRQDELYTSFQLGEKVIFSSSSSHWAWPHKKISKEEKCQVYIINGIDSLSGNLRLDPGMNFAFNDDLVKYDIPQLRKPRNLTVQRELGPPANLNYALTFSSAGRGEPRPDYYDIYIDDILVAQHLPEGLQTEGSVSARWYDLSQLTLTPGNHYIQVQAMSANQSVARNSALSDPLTLEVEQDSNPIPPVAPAPHRAVNVVNGFGGGFFPVGQRVEILATPPSSNQEFTHWTVEAGGITLDDNQNSMTHFVLGDADVTVQAHYADKQEPPTPPVTPPTPPVTPPTTTCQIAVGRTVRVNTGVRTWATGEGMPSWVHGRTYPVIERRVRDGVCQLLLGAGINSWIRESDVTLISSDTSTTPIRINDRVRVNTGVRTWATGEGMPSWVHGRIYTVIEMRTREGATQLLLGNGINSWIRMTDVTRV